MVFFIHNHHHGVSVCVLGRSIKLLVSRCQDCWKTLKESVCHSSIHTGQHLMWRSHQLLYCHRVVSPSLWTGQCVPFIMRYVFVCVCVCVRVCVCTCVCVCVCTCVRVCVSTILWLFTYTHVYTCICRCIQKCACMYLQVYMLLSTYICITYTTPHLSV